MNDREDPPTRPRSPGDASRRGLESLHDGKEHPTEGEILPEHDENISGPTPGEAHRGGPLPNEKK
ncbi:MAG: hypothetical protein M3R44_06305 [Candidatus Eremiobacteraeota bacterium]|nr:hypothetical protein [Candidatus Eremiobacteraeota bacterium]